MDYIPGHHRAGDVFALQVQTAAVGNVGTGEDTLQTYTLPANLLSRTRKGVRVTCWGSTANNANAKTLKFYFGSALLFTASLTTGQGSPWRLVAEVLKTGANAQRYAVQFAQGGPTKQTDVARGTAAETDTATIVVKCTGDATADADIFQEGMIVEVLNA